jgi:hypothetical protein
VRDVKAARAEPATFALILSKLVWMKDSRSEIQRRDVQNVLDAVSDLDLAYIESWANELGVLAVWQEIVT